MLDHRISIFNSVCILTYFSFLKKKAELELYYSLSYRHCIIYLGLKEETKDDLFINILKKVRWAYKKKKIQQKIFIPTTITFDDFHVSEFMCIKSNCNFFCHEM